MKFIRLLSAITALFACLTACEHSEPRSLYFIGDSIIARWDIDRFISGYAVYNDGKSGAGFDYLETFGKSMKGRTVVVMIGTNDMGSQLDDTALRKMAGDYVDAVVGLDAGRLFLYSVLPRDFATDFEGKNDMIKQFNIYVEDMVKAYPNIVYINVFNDFMLNGGTIDRDLYTDRLHLSPSGYEILSKALLDIL